MAKEPIPQPSMRVTQRDLEDAEDLDFTEEKEYWSTYKLSDGTTLKVKLVLTGVKRLHKWNLDGSPVYLINATNAVRAVDVPKKLKAKQKVRTFKPV